MPIGVGLRYVGGRVLGETCQAALFTGVFVGVVGWLAITWDSRLGAEGITRGLAFAAIAGLIGGLVWAQCEKPRRASTQ